MTAAPVTLPPGCGVPGCADGCAMDAAFCRTLRLEALAAACWRRLHGPTLADTVDASIEIRRLVTGREQEAAELAAWHARHAAGGAAIRLDTPEAAATGEGDTSPPPSPPECGAECERRDGFTCAPGRCAIALGEHWVREPVGPALPSQVAPVPRARKPRQATAPAGQSALFDWTPSEAELAARAAPPPPPTPPPLEADAIACAECLTRNPCQFPACLPAHLRPAEATPPGDTSPPPSPEPEPEPEGPPVLPEEAARPFAALEAALARELGPGAAVRVDPYDHGRACVGATLAPGRRLVTHAMRPTLIRPAVTLAAEIAAELRAWRPPGAEISPPPPAPEAPPYGHGPRDDADAN